MKILLTNLFTESNHSCIAYNIKKSKHETYGNQLICPRKKTCYAQKRCSRCCR